MAESAIKRFGVNRPSRFITIHVGHVEVHQDQRRSALLGGQIVGVAYIHVAKAEPEVRAHIHALYLAPEARSEWAQVERFSSSWSTLLETPARES